MSPRASCSDQINLGWSMRVRASKEVRKPKRAKISHRVSALTPVTLFTLFHTPHEPWERGMFLLARYKLFHQEKKNLISSASWEHKTTGHKVQCQLCHPWVTETSTLPEKEEENHPAPLMGGHRGLTRHLSSESWQVPAALKSRAILPLQIPYY